jgi:CDP-glucose 4,6-dehydratase
MVNFNLFNNSYKGKRVLITGHTGFKGSWLTLWLFLLGANIAGFSNKEKTKPSLFEILKLKKKINSFVGDISKKNEITKVIKKFQPEIIFHLAAQALVKKSYLNPVETFQTNSIGTLNLLLASKASKKLKAIVMITSDKVYKNIEIKRGYIEKDILMGNDPYSASKSCSEIIINMYVKSFLQKQKIMICTTRAGNVIGGGDWSQDRIIPDLFKQWSKSQSLEIRNPNSTRPWQFVLEPIGAYLYLGSLLLKRKKKINLESFNVGPKKNIDKKVLDVIKLAKVNLKNLKYKNSKDKSKKEARLLKLNCNKIFKYTKWKPIYNFKETVLNTTLWYLNYYNKKENNWDFSKNQIKKYIEAAKKKNLSWMFDA